MSDILLKTCWACNELWNNKFRYQVASCWLLLLSPTIVFHAANSHNIKSRQLQPKGRKNLTSKKCVFRLKVKGNHWCFYKCNFGNGILYRNQSGIVICNFHKDRPLLVMIVVRKSCIRSWTVQSRMTVSFVCRLRRASLLTVNIGTIINRDFHSTSLATEMVRCCFNLSISIVIIDSKWR